MISILPDVFRLVLLDEPPVFAVVVFVSYLARLNRPYNELYGRL